MASGIVKTQSGEILTRNVDVTLPKSSGNVALVAPNENEYEFLCWVGVASIGTVKNAYIENMFGQSTKIFIEGTAGSAINYRGFALYQKGLKHDE